MVNVLLIIHFIGLGMGFTAAAGGAVVGGMIAKSPPAEAMVLGRVPFALSMVGAWGLGLLWASGLIMFFLIFGSDPAGLSWTFSAKMLFVVILTVVVVLMNLRLRRIKQTGDRSLAAILPILGRIAGISLLLVIVFAVLTFNMLG